jgi:hypothetical protein
MLFVVLAGSPRDGFKVYGPFDERADAEEWIDGELMDSETAEAAWSAPLLTPMYDEDE